MGLILGAAAGIGFGFYQAFTRRALRDIGAFQSTFLQVAIGAVLAGAAVLAFGRIPTAGLAFAKATLWFSLAGVFNWGVGVALLSVSQKRIGAVRTAPLIATTPLFGMVIAVPTLGEFPSGVAIVGTAIMLAGVVVASGDAEPGRGARPPRGSFLSFQRSLPGLGTAFCWALTAIFVRKGIGDAGPLFGVWIGMLAVVVGYALAFASRVGRSWRPVPRHVFVAELTASAVVALATWTLWVALGKAKVGPVLALSLLQVPTAMIVSPIVAGRGGEQRTRAAILSAALVGAGALAVLVLG